MHRDIAGIMQSVHELCYIEGRGFGDLGCRAEPPNIKQWGHKSGVHSETCKMVRLTYRWGPRVERVVFQAK